MDQARIRFGDMAMDVAGYASRELHNDKNNRKQKYDALGWAHDETVIND